MTPWLDDGDVRLYHGDALEQLALMPSESVQCIVTSPPFWGLRDYGTGTWTGGDTDCDHKPETKPERKFTNGRGEGTGDEYAGSNLRSWTTRDGTPFGLACGKCGARRVDQQIGLEETPDEWCARLVGVMREARRVLRADGVCWIEVGDTYSGSARGNAPGDLSTSGLTNPQRQDAVNEGRQSTLTPGVKPKDLVGAPWLLAFALRADGWYLRSDTIWARPNPMPESVTDRPTKAHSYVFLLTKSARYFYDADAIREAHDDKAGGIDRFGKVGSAGGYQPDNAGNADIPMARNSAVATNGRVYNPAGRNARSVWSIPTEPTPFAHFATFPQALVERCIKAGTSEHGACSECGAPWRRITQASGDYAGRAAEHPYRHLLDPAEFGAHVRERRLALGHSMRAVDEACGTNTACSWWEGRANGQQLPSASVYLNLKPFLGIDDRFDRYFEETPATRSGWTEGDHADGFINAKRGVSTTKQTTTLGWEPSCGCRALAAQSGYLDEINNRGRPRPCVVLDPFMGSGTTALVARRLGRHAIGIELNAEYLGIAAKRLEQLSLFATNEGAP